MKKISVPAAVAMGLLAMHGNAQADAGGPPATTTDPWLKINNGTDLIGTSSSPNPDHSFTFDSSSTVAGQYSVGWDLRVNPDPFVDGTITLTNLSANAKDFTINLGLSVSPAFNPSKMGGSISASLSDLNGSGSATLQPVTSLSNPIFQGRIDGSTVLELMAASISCIGVNCTATGGDQDGLPGLTLPSGAVNSSLGTLLTFNLSGGDRVTLNTHFEVAPVPLPASLPLLSSVLGMGVGAFRRKRKT